MTGTRNLVQALSKLSTTLVLCASAIGYYGSRGDEVLTEEGGPRYWLPGEICEEWEREAAAAEAFGMRVAAVRTGIVLDRGEAPSSSRLSDGVWAASRQRPPMDVVDSPA